MQHRIQLARLWATEKSSRTRASGTTQHGRRGGKRRALNRVLLSHELTLVFLLVITVTAAGIWGYLWQRASRESARLNELTYTLQQTRSDLYRQIKDVTQARLAEDPRALDMYWTSTRRIQQQFNHLRRFAVADEEVAAVTGVEAAYGVIRDDMNRVFTNPYTISDEVRMRLLDPRRGERLTAGFESAANALMDVANRERGALEAHRKRAMTLLVAIMALPILLAATLVVLSRRSLQRGFLRPVAEIKAGAQQIAAGRLDHQVPETGVEEMASLAHDINAMARELAVSRDALVEKEREAALGALVPVVGHNIRNPLASIRATAQVLEDLDSQSELREAQHAIIQTVDRLDRWVRSLVSYLHPLQPRLRGTSLASVVEAALELLDVKLAEKGLRVVWLQRLDDDAVRCDPELVEQAVFGLLVNAIDASPRGAELQLRVTRDASGLALSITDQGPGMAFVPAPRGLRPGPSTKRGGTGLGIPFAFKVFQAHGWTLEFESHGGAGTTVTVRIPIQGRTIAERDEE